MTFLYFMRWLFCDWFAPGFGGGSSSSSSSTTNNTDKRLVVDGGVGVSADHSSVSTSIVSTTNITDGGAVSRALDTVDLSNATLGDGYGKLLDATRDFFDRGEGLIGQTQKSVADAYARATENPPGAVSERTMLALAAAAVAGLFIWKRK